MSFQIRHKSHPEYEFKLAIGDTGLFGEIARDPCIGHLDKRGNLLPHANWHQQITFYYDCTIGRNTDNPTLLLGSLNHCLRTRKIHAFAPIPANKNIDRYHTLTLKLENGFVPVDIVGIPGAGFFSRVEFNVYGLHTHDPSPFIIRKLKTWERRGNTEHPSGPTDLNYLLKECLHSLKRQTNLRLIGSMSYTRYDGIVRFNKTNIAHCLDKVEMRTPDGRKREYMELELELIPDLTKSTNFSGISIEELLASHPGFIQLAEKIYHNYGLVSRQRSKAKKYYDFLMENPHLESDGRYGILWPQAAKRLRRRMGKRQKSILHFLING